MVRDLRAVALAGTAALTILVAGCGDGGKAMGAADGRSPPVARTRPTADVVKGSGGAASLAAAAAADDDLETTPLSGALTPTDLVQTVLGSGVTVSNVRYRGAETAAGTFDGPASVVGFESGIVLSTGAVGNVRGPNELDDVTTINRTEGDDDLSELAGLETLDAAVLSFDFIPAGGTITFDYVLASDEYNESVNTEFNDVFAFYVNGKNCAVVGDPAQPVSINTINDGNPEEGEDHTPSNPDLYRNNDLSDGGGEINTEMDGLTAVLTCRAEVNPGVNNTMKLAIADATDPVLDAVVFIKAGSFEAQNHAPHAMLEGPDEGDVGEALDFTTSATDEDGDALTCRIDWGDGTPEAEVPCDGTRTHTFARAGTYAVTLTARDPDGADGTDDLQVRIDEVAPPACSEGTGARPALELVGVFSRIAVRAFAQGIPEGEMLRFRFHDADCGPWTTRVDWGDGQTSEFPISEELGPGLYNTFHAYASPGDYVIRMTITDAAGLASAEHSMGATVIDESGTP